MLDNHGIRATQSETLPQAEDDMPEPFKCPISWEPMRDPVFAYDGHVYERQNMQKWFATGGCTSPLTNERLPDVRLVTAWPIRKLMDAHPQARLHLRPPQQEKSLLGKTPAFSLAPPPPAFVFGDVPVRNLLEPPMHWRGWLHHRAEREAAVAAARIDAAAEIERIRNEIRGPFELAVQNLGIDEARRRVMAVGQPPGVAARDREGPAW